MVRALNDALYALVERAAAALPVAANESLVTLHFLRGTGARCGAPERAAHIGAPLRARLDADRGRGATRTGVGICMWCVSVTME
jgi:hypothetical protein